jgi:PAS domain S-box-containing protein
VQGNAKTMKKENKNLPEALSDKVSQTGTSLRQKAEEKLKKAQTENAASQSSGTVRSEYVRILKGSSGEAGIRKLVHELEVHQIELEMQNQELKLALEKTATATALYDFSPAGYFTLEHDGTIRELNLSGAQLLGKERAGLINSSFGLLVTRGTRPVFNDFLHKAFETNSKQTCEIRLVIKGNVSNYFYLEGFVSANEQKCLVTAIDITDLKRAEEELKEREEHYRTLVEVSPEVIYSTTDDGTITALNPAFETITGWSCAEWIGKSFVGLIHPDDVQENIGRFHEVLRGETKHAYEVRMLSKSGVYMVGEFTSAPYIREGKIVGMQGVGRDITGRKQAEKAIRLNEARLKRAELASKSGNWELHLDSQKMIGSEGALKIYGVNQSQFGYEVIKEFPLPEFRQLLDAALKNLLEENKPYDVEYKIRTGDTGELKDIHSVATFDKEKRILFGIIQDITARKLMEDRIHESEQYYRTLVETSPDAIVIINSTGQLQYASQRAYELFDVPAEQIVSGSSILNWIAPDVREKIFEKFRVILSGLVKPEPSEYKLIRNDGSILWAEIHASCLLDAEGQVKGLLLVCRDITSRKLAEEARRESVELFQGLFNASPDAIVLIDPHYPWPIVDCNEAACLMNGYTREELIGHSIDLLNTTVGKPEERIAYLETIRQKGAIHIETEHRHKDGHIITVEVSTSIVTLGGREMVLGIDRDVTKRKMVEKALHESEYFFKESQHAAFIGSYKMNLITGLWESSEVLDQIFGIDKNYSRSVKGWLDITHPVDKEMMDKYLKEDVISKQKPFYKEYRIIRKSDGQVRWVLGQGKLDFDAEGNIISMIGTIQDITERKQVEVSLKKSETEFRTVWKNSASGMRITDESGIIYQVNDAYCKMFGKSAEELVGKPLSVIYFAGANENIQFKYQERFDRRSVENNTEKELKLWNGKKIWVQVAYSFLEIENEKPKLFGIFTDITQRKMTEEESRESEEKFRMVFENVFDGISIYAEDPDYYKRRLIECNEQYAAMAGLSREELLKSGYTQTLQVAIENSNDARFESLTSRKAFRGSYSWIRPDGKGNIIEYIGVPIMWRGKSCTIGIDRDITQRKHVEEELIAAKEKAEESDRLKSAFLANMSHEIRTPLNSIIGFSELMTDQEYDTTQQFQFAQIINTSGNNLLAIISDIMDISKIESGQVQVRKRSLSVNQLIIDIQKEYSFKAIEKGIELRLDLSNPKEEVFIESDETKLRQILVNFVGNAIKFTKEGFIVIGFRITSDFIQFHVKDTGIGIPKEFHEQIFERFRQVENSNTRKYGGNGLGLAISKGLVELLGGKLWMESEEGIGSTFYFTVPV